MRLETFNSPKSRVINSGASEYYNKDQPNSSSTPRKSYLFSNIASSAALTSASGRSTHRRSTITPAGQTSEGGYTYSLSQHSTKETGPYRCPKSTSNSICIAYAQTPGNSNREGHQIINRGNRYNKATDINAYKKVPAINLPEQRRFKSRTGSEQMNAFPKKIHLHTTHNEPKLFVSSGIKMKKELSSSVVPPSAQTTRDASALVLRPSNLPLIKHASSPSRRKSTVSNTNCLQSDIRSPPRNKIASSTRLYSSFAQASRSCSSLQPLQAKHHNPNIPKNKVEYTLDSSVRKTRPPDAFALQLTPVKSNATSSAGQLTEARINRKIQDLEISNASLLAVNKYLEKRLRSKLEKEHLGNISASNEVSTEDTESEEENELLATENSPTGDKNLPIKLNAMCSSEQTELIQTRVQSHIDYLNSSEKVNQTMRECLSITSALLQEASSSLGGDSNPLNASNKVLPLERTRHERKYSVSVLAGGGTRSNLRTPRDLAVSRRSNKPPLY